MRSFRMLEHRADVRLQLRADTLEELLLAGLEGLNEVLKPGFCSGGPPVTAAAAPTGDKGPAATPQALPLRHRFHLVAPDATALVVDFLSEVLTRVQIDRAMYCRAELRLTGTTGLDAELRGAPVPALDEDVKAVTYHEADVRRQPDGKWTTGLVLDI